MSIMKEAVLHFIDKFKEDGRSKEHTFNITKSNPHFQVLLDKFKANGTFTEEVPGFNMTVNKSGFMLRITLVEVIGSKRADEIAIEEVSKFYKEDGSKGYCMYSLSKNFEGYKDLREMFDEAEAYSFVVQSDNFGSVLFCILESGNIGIDLFYNEKNSLDVMTLERMRVLSNVMLPDTGLKGFVNSIFKSYPNVNKEAVVLGLGYMFNIPGMIYDNKEELAKVLKENVYPFYNHYADLDIYDLYKSIGYIEPEKEVTEITKESWLHSLTDKDIQYLAEKYPILQYMSISDLPITAVDTIYAEELKIS